MHRPCRGSAYVRTYDAAPKAAPLAGLVNLQLLEGINKLALLVRV